MPRAKTNKYSRFIVFLFIYISVNAKAQDSPALNDTSTTYRDGLVAIVETLPHYPGGVKKFNQLIEKEYRFTSSAIEAAVKGKVVVSFVVDKDGSLTDFKVLSDLGYDTGEQLIKVLKMSERWIPGMQNGKPVRVQYSLPVNLEAPVLKNRRKKKHDLRHES